MTFFIIFYFIPLIIVWFLTYPVHEHQPFFIKALSDYNKQDVPVSFIQKLGFIPIANIAIAISMCYLYNIDTQDYNFFINKFNNK